MPTCEQHPPLPRKAAETNCWGRTPEVHRCLANVLVPRGHFGRTGRPFSEAMGLLIHPGERGMSESGSTWPPVAGRRGATIRCWPASAAAPLLRRLWRELVAASPLVLLGSREGDVLGHPGGVTRSMFWSGAHRLVGDLRSTLVCFASRPAGADACSVWRSSSQHENGTCVVARVVAGPLIPERCSSVGKVGALWPIVGDSSSFVDIHIRHLRPTISRR